VPEAYVYGKTGLLKALNLHFFTSFIISFANRFFMMLSYK